MLVGTAGLGGNRLERSHRQTCTFAVQCRATNDVLCVIQRHKLQCVILAMFVEGNIISFCGCLVAHDCCDQPTR